jgi:glycosyltransferase involved in cell wall biosynthesis
MSETGKRLHIGMIASALPPQLDGIGDYSATMAKTLAKRARVTVYTVVGQEHEPLAGVDIVPIFDVGKPGTVRQLLPRIQADKPDWILLEYNPFCYGKWGYNPWLPATLAQVKRKVPGIGIAVMAHETFMPFMKFTWGVMNLWQYPQFYALGNIADILFLSVDTWVAWFEKWFPRTPVRHSPIGSAIPEENIARAEARCRLGIKPETLVLGQFGTAHPSRLFDWVGEAYRRVHAEFPDSLLLYIGPHREEILRFVGDLPILAEGPFPPEEVSRRFAAVDIMLAPYRDGISSRRSAFMTGLQHGIPSVSTHGPVTDKALLEQNGKAFLLGSRDVQEEFNAQVLSLARNAAERKMIGEGGAGLYYARYDAELEADRIVQALETVRRN